MAAWVMEVCWWWSNTSQVRFLVGNVVTSLFVNKWPLLRSGWLGGAGQIPMWKCLLQLWLWLFFGQFICWECDQKLHVCTFLVENKVYIFYMKILTVLSYKRFLSFPAWKWEVPTYLKVTHLGVYKYLWDIWIIGINRILHTHLLHWRKCHRIADMHIMLNTQAYVVA